MLGRTASGMFWMFRYLERSENTARLIETGLRIALTRGSDTSDEWASILDTTGARSDYLSRHEQIESVQVVDFLLRDPSNPSSIRALVDRARQNAREVRTALTREVWEATNDSWHNLNLALSVPPEQRALPDILAMIRQDSAQVRGALHGTMLRNDIYNFSRLGTFLERADNTARILDVKYYVLLPNLLDVGSPLDNAQWESVLRSLSAQRSYHWQCGGEVSAASIAKYLILDSRMPRSLVFCSNRTAMNLTELCSDYGQSTKSEQMSIELRDKLRALSIDEVFNNGLHEFLRESIQDLGSLANQIQIDYRFAL